ncbi:MAG: hypothetical protein R3F56_08155 [Planctomycetota bacterium]
MSARHGSEVYRDLQQRATGARNEVDTVASELRNVQQRTQDLMTRRTASVQRLAEHYLPTLDDRSIENNAAGVQAQLRAVQERQRAEVASLREQGAALTKVLAEHEATLHDVTARLDVCVQRRAALEADAAKLLERDPEFEPLAKRAAETERELARDEERAQAIAREAADKLPAYERSRLFQYLVKRDYGTAEYRGRGLIRRLDRWVAGLVDFARAKQGYDFLRVTPELVAAEVKRRHEEFEPVMQSLQGKQAQAAAAVGLPAVLAEGEALGSERDRLVQAMTEAQQAHRQVSEELARAEAADGKYHAEALVTLRGFLEHTETRALEQRARITPEPQDDALVTEIAAARGEEADLSLRLQALSAQRTELEGRAIDLERLARRFREANFDASRSRFQGLDLDGAMARFEQGASGIDDVWNELRRRQQFERPAPSVEIGTGVFGGGQLGTGSRVLLEAMGHVVGAALRASAQRSVMRSGTRRSDFRVGGGRGGGGGGSRGSGGGGFTRIDGF